MNLNTSKLNIDFRGVRTVQDLEDLLFKETQVRTIIRLDPSYEVLSISKLDRVFNCEYMNKSMTVARWRLIIENALFENVGQRGHKLIPRISKRFISIFAPKGSSKNGNTLLNNVREASTTTIQ